MASSVGTVLHKRRKNKEVGVPTKEQGNDCIALKHSDKVLSFSNIFSVVHMLHS